MDLGWLYGRNDYARCAECNDGIIPPDRPFTFNWHGRICNQEKDECVTCYHARRAIWCEQVRNNEAAIKLEAKIEKLNNA